MANDTENKTAEVEEQAAGSKAAETEAKAAENKVDAAESAKAKKPAAGEAKPAAKGKQPQKPSKKKLKKARREERARQEAEALAAAEAAANKGLFKKKKRAAKPAPKRGRGKRVGLVIAVAIGCAAMVLSVCGIACSGIINNTSSSEDYALTGGVAATVNGTNITEDTITKQIMSVRTSGYKKDKKWAQYLVDQDLTPKKYRKQTIDSYVQQVLIKQAEEEYGVNVTDKDVNKEWKKACKNSGGRKTFVKTLKMYGYTVSSYKSSLKSSLALDKLKDKVSPKKKISDKKLLKNLNKDLDTYNDARKSSQILIKVDSSASKKEKRKAKKKAQKVLDQINSGELSWDKAVKKYSEDTGSKTSGSKGNKGNVGWDKLTSFVDEYQTALEALSEGQMSGLVKSTYGYHIIKCTGYFHVDGEATDAKAVPRAIRKTIIDSLQSTQVSDDYNAWLKKYKKKADITINKMPEDVPYNVSLKGVSKSSTTSSDSATVTTDTTDDSSTETESADESSTDETTDDSASE